MLPITTTISEFLSELISEEKISAEPFAVAERTTSAVKWTTVADADAAGSNQEPTLCKKP
ncbi:hypothetical protein AM506_09295 [Rossellomorea vietnamensis]|uniref:Uncharacterized protein n=1 Tax=Rossellomorea vietnamensis TaxID=218284 RepID=A0A0P6W1K8_9BACI|nr:hypothetical protein AM506_09295 [Rossellomorea vietnamensis]